MNKGQLFVVSGPSGAGKGTICKALEVEGSIALSVSITTRLPRPGEVEGISYYFVSKAEFVNMAESGELLEYAEVYGNYYGTPAKKVLEKLEEGIDVILEIDCQGAMQVKERYPGAILIFILPPSMQKLRERINGRGSETEEAIRLRMSNALSEIEYIKDYDYYVVNNELDLAVKRVKTIIDTGRARISKNADTAEMIIKKYKEEI
jgi:guanylate kinase